jgi:protein TonB
MKSSLRISSMAMVTAACLPCLLYLLPVPVASAQDDAPYSPKFAREQQSGQALLDSCAKPEWPRYALRNNQTGSVILRFTIAPTGRLLKQEVVRSSGYPLLDKAAIEGLSLCRFRPGSINGKPVQSVESMQYVWTLE